MSDGWQQGINIPSASWGGIAGKGEDEATPTCDSSPQQAAGYSRWNFIKIGVDGGFIGKLHRYIDSCRYSED